MISHSEPRAPRSPRRTRRWLAVLAIVPATGLLGAGVAQGAPAAGNAKPFSLSATAVLAQDGSTALTLAVTSADAAYAVPSSLKHVQLKSFDGAGELVFTKNVTNVATPGGTTTLMRTDLQAGQPVKVQAQAQTGATKNTQVIDAVAVVQRRPDLTVTATAAAQVAPGTTLPIAAVVEELNGDLGATGTVSVTDGTTTLDSVGVTVAAGATTNAGLAVVLDEPGLHTLTVSVGGVQPTEWDSSNNATSIVVEVIEANQTLDYNAYYQNLTDYHYEWQSDGTGYYGCYYYYYYCGPRHYVYDQQSEYLSVQYWTNQTISPSGTFDLTIGTEAGVAQTLQATDLQWNGYSWYWYDPASNTQIQVHPGYGGGSNVQVWHHAGTWTYSDSYCDYWYGCNTYTGSSTQGTYWDARERISVDLDVPTTTGDHFGGSLDILLSPYQYTWDQSYWDWYEGNVHYWGTQNYFTGSASGTTSW